MPTTLADEPSEILEHIIYYIDRPRDLLHLALAAKTMRDLIIPTHLEFRVIRSHLDLPRLWDMLAAFPSVTARIAVLEIVRRSDYNEDKDLIAPKRFTEELDAAGIPIAEMPNPRNAFPKALGLMTGLTSFHWSSSSCPINVLSMLKVSCPNILDVEVQVATPDADSVMRLLRSSFCELSGLRRFSLVFISHFEELNAALVRAWFDRLIDMLVDRCPNLKDLHLLTEHSANLSVSPLLRRARWPSLTRLSLFVTFYRADIIDSFLDRHTTLDRVRLVHVGPANLILAPNKLMNLRSLHLDGNAQITIPPGIADTLEHLGLRTTQATSLLLPRMSNLRSLFWSNIRPREEVRPLSACAPHLEKLAIGGFLYEMSFPDFIGMVEGLNELTCIKILGVHAYTKLAGYDDVETFRSFAIALPALQYIEIKRRDHLYTDNLFVIEREPDGSYAGFRTIHVTNVANMLDDRKWGEFYHGAAAH